MDELLSKMSHGGDIYLAAKLAKCSPADIIDFSSNINPTRPHIDLNIQYDDFVAYADSSYSQLKDTLAEKYALWREQIGLFNGASSAIFALFEQLDFSEVTLYAPIYGEYKKAAEKLNKKINLINRFAQTWEKPMANSLVIFVNPSTPDGSYYDLDKLLQEWAQLNCTVIIDESFIEFSDKASFRQKIKENKKLFIIQSFTKFYACAGLRVGAVFSHEENIKRLHTPIWHLSSIDVKLLSRLLGDNGHKKRSLDNLNALTLRLEKILNASKLFDEVFASSANYVLVKTPQALSLQEQLLGHKILVRNCLNFDFLGKDYLRFAVKDELALDALQKALNALS